MFGKPRDLGPQAQSIRSASDLRAALRHTAIAELLGDLCSPESAQGAKSSRQERIIADLRVGFSIRFCSRPERNFLSNLKVVTFGPQSQVIRSASDPGAAIRYTAIAELLGEFRSSGSAQGAKSSRQERILADLRVGVTIRFCSRPERKFFFKTTHRTFQSISATSIARVSNALSFNNASRSSADLRYKHSLRHARIFSNSRTATGHVRRFSY